MLKAVFLDKSSVSVLVNKDSVFSGEIDGKKFEWSIEKTDSNTWHVIDDENYSFQISVIGLTGDSYKLDIDGQRIDVMCQSEFGQMLDNMGISSSAAAKIKEVKAPMPGLVISIDVSPGQEVNKGDSLLILEAMKMENVIKSEGDAVVKKVCVSSGETIEKGALIIEFE